MTLEEHIALIMPKTTRLEGYGKNRRSVQFRPPWLGRMDERLEELGGDLFIDEIIQVSRGAHVWFYPNKAGESLRQVLELIKSDRSVALLSTHACIRKIAEELCTK